MTDNPDTLANRCYLQFGKPRATSHCTSSCRSSVIHPFPTTIVPVFYCVEHNHVWPNPDGSAHDTTVLTLAHRHFNANCEEGNPPCHPNCRALSLSHKLAERGLWRPPERSVSWCPDHGYLHICCGSETPCNHCYACGAGLWCIFRCRGELYGNKGVPACPWSGRELSNVDAPLTKPIKAVATHTIIKSTHDPQHAGPAIVAPPRRKSPNMNIAYLNEWHAQWRLQNKGIVLQRTFNDVEDIVASWGAVSSEWPVTLHISGWVYLLSSLNMNKKTLPLTPLASHLPFIDALASTQFRKERASNAADAIVCYMMTHAIPDFVLTQLRHNNGLFASNQPAAAIDKKKSVRNKARQKKIKSENEM